MIRMQAWRGRQIQNLPVGGGQRRPAAKRAEHAISERPRRLRIRGAAVFGDRSVPAAQRGRQAAPGQLAGITRQQGRSATDVLPLVRLQRHGRDMQQSRRLIEREMRSVQGDIAGSRMSGTATAIFRGKRSRGQIHQPVAAVHAR